MNIRNQHHREVVIIEWSSMTDCLCCEPSLDQVRWSSLSQCWWSRLVSPNGSLIWLVPAHHRTPLNLNSLVSLGVRHTTSAWRTRQIVAWRHESAHHSYIRILLINIYSEQNTQINQLITHKNTCHKQPPHLLYKQFLLACFARVYVPLEHVSRNLIQINVLLRSFLFEVSELGSCHPQYCPALCVSHHCLHPMCPPVSLRDHHLCRLQHYTTVTTQLHLNPV